MTRREFDLATAYLQVRSTISKVSRCEPQAGPYVLRVRTTFFDPLTATSSDGLELAVWKGTHLRLSVGFLSIHHHGAIEHFGRFLCTCHTKRFWASLRPGYWDERHELLQKGLTWIAACGEAWPDPLFPGKGLVLANAKHAWEECICFCNTVGRAPRGQKHTKTGGTVS